MPIDPTSADRYTVTTAMQRFSIRGVTRYLKVRAQATTSRAAVPETVARAAIQELISDVVYIRARTRLIRALEAGEPETNVFLKKTMFAGHLEGHYPTALWLRLNDPKAVPDVRNPLDRMTTGLKKICESTLAYLEQNLDMSARMEVNSRWSTAGQPAETGQLNIVMPKTIQNYLGIWKKILTYTMSVAINQQKGDQGGRLPITLSSEQMAALDAATNVREEDDDKMREAKTLMDSLLRVPL
ncbi:hypothetical protein VTK26DRAFT_1219 [Humicola hyalothermophila]